MGYTIEQYERFVHRLTQITVVDTYLNNCEYKVLHSDKDDTSEWASCSHSQKMEEWEAKDTTDMLSFLNYHKNLDIKVNDIPQAKE